MSIIRHEHYDDTGLVETIELENVAGAVRYSRIVAGATVEDRVATQDETAEYVAGDKSLRAQTVEVNLLAGARVLRQWADQAQGTTVTTGNAVATLQTVVDRLGVFFDRFADLLVLLDRIDIDDFD